MQFELLNWIDTQIKINLSAMRHLHSRCGAHQLGTMMHAVIELRMPFMLSSSETQVLWWVYRVNLVA